MIMAELKNRERQAFGFDEFLLILLTLVIFGVPIYITILMQS